MSQSTPSSPFKPGKDMEQMKEDARSQNSSLEKTRVELVNVLLAAHCEANIAKKLQEEAECKAQLEALEKLIRQ